MLDNLSPAMRHLALLALAAVLSFLATNIDLLGMPGGVRAVAGPLLTAALAALTPLTRQYGVGSVIPGEVDPVEGFDPNSTGMVIEDH